MKILVTGANGLAGQHLVKQLLETTNHTIVATGRNSSRLPFTHPRLQYYPLDITDGTAATAFYIKAAPEAIIHSAAMTLPDDCELNKISCWNNNVTATRFLSEAAKRLNAYFIYLSTDFVFDGEKGMYRETDTPAPVNYYGSSKLAAEKTVFESRLDAAIVRTCLVYGNILQGSRSNIISWVKESLQQRKQIKVVSDQLRTPTYVEDFVNGILLALEQKTQGIFHISGADILTPYDMALATAYHLGLDASLIEKVDASVFKQAAQRPAKTGFDISKPKKILGYQPVDFKTGLMKMLDD